MADRAGTPLSEDAERWRLHGTGLCLVSDDDDIEPFLGACGRTKNPTYRDLWFAPAGGGIESRDGYYLTDNPQSSEDVYMSAYADDAIRTFRKHTPKVCCTVIDAGFE